MAQNLTVAARKYERGAPAEKNGTDEPPELSAL
jgi:hypothetical protein